MIVRIYPTPLATVPSQVLRFTGHHAFMDWLRDQSGPVAFEYAATHDEKAPQ